MIFELRNLLTQDTAFQLTRALASAPFHDGKRTASGCAAAVKNNLQLDESNEISQRCAAVVLAALSRHESFKSAAIPRTIMPLRFCKYRQGMSYGEHLDLPLVSTANGPLRTDLSVTVWLSNTDDYVGGDLVLQTAVGERRLRGNAGDAVVYPSNTRHRVAPVTKGERLVAISWIQSMVPDHRQRELLCTLARALAKVHAGDATEGTAEDLRGVHHELLRMWASC